MDETYVRIKGRWFYLYRAIDSSGATIDFFLSAFRSADAAKALFAKALADPSHPQPRVINTDQAKCYPAAIDESKGEGVLRKRCRHRPVLGLSPGVRQTVKTLFAVRCVSFGQRRPGSARCSPAGEAEAGPAGAQPAKE